MDNGLVLPAINHKETTVTWINCQLAPFLVGIIGCELVEQTHWFVEPSKELVVLAAEVHQYLKWRQIHNLFNAFEIKTSSIPGGCAKCALQTVLCVRFALRFLTFSCLHIDIISLQYEQFSGFSSASAVSAHFSQGLCGKNRWSVGAAGGNQKFFLYLQHISDRQVVNISYSKFRRWADLTIALPNVSNRFSCFNRKRHLLSGKKTNQHKKQ